MTRLSRKIFSNDFTAHFEGDDTGIKIPRQTPGVFYSKALPTPVKNPHLLGWSEELAAALGISRPDEEDIDVLAGNKVTPSMYPYAACYAGHQFGNWAGQLGDGRAISLGEWTCKKGSFDLQLKGAGPTAYSRRADGRAVLRSSLREYLVSEAMHHLRVPTTRALSLVTTGEQVLRDMFYDGNPEYEPGAVVMRISESFLRFGNFELHAARGEKDQLEKLIDWTISRYYPQHQHKNLEDRVIGWFGEVIERTAYLIGEWQRVGFVHGVMNTDNMSILGQTIDFGPFSFLDHYDPGFTPNTTDLPGRRYAFGNQPSVAYWNLSRLANALSLLFEDTGALEEALDSYEPAFWNAYYAVMGKKLGLDQVQKRDKKLISEFEKTLSEIQPDMTLFYRLLSEVPSDASEVQVIGHFKNSFYQEPQKDQREQLTGLIQKYDERLKTNSISREEAKTIMNRNNPRLILRNYLLHQSAEKLEAGDMQLFLKLQAAMKEPYAAEGHEDIVGKRPEWAEEKAGCSMLSCSS